MKKIDVELIKSKTTSSVLFLSIRNIGVQLISTVGFFILTILLGTGEVGLFAIVAESVGILGYFSDIGLASALIQKKKEVTTKELRTTFFVQQILVITAITIFLLFYFQISQIKTYGTKETIILISLCISFFIASLKTIPSVLLERKLNFKILSTIDVVENVLFYLIAVIMAFAGFGAYSYAGATIIRSVIGLIIIYVYNPWPIGFSFSLESVKTLFKFGIPFQLNSFIAVAKDRLSNLLVAGIIGRESFGILSWAQKGPRIPLSFMDSIIRVTFPTFSRIQEHKDLLKNSITKSVFYISFLTFPALGGICLIAPNLINLIPKYSKWLPALFPLYLYSINAAIAAVTTPLTNAFNAVGKISTTTKLMIMWTILTWIFYPLLSYKFNYIGTAFATLAVGSSSFVVWFLANKQFSVDIFKTIFHPFFSTILMIIFLSVFNSFYFSQLIMILIKIFCGILFYFIYAYIFTKTELFWFINQIRCLLNKK